MLEFLSHAKYIGHLDAFRLTKNSVFNFRNHSCGERRNISNWLFLQWTLENFSQKHQFHTLVLLVFSDFSVGRLRDCYRAEREGNRWLYWVTEKENSEPFGFVPNGKHLELRVKVLNRCQKGMIQGVIRMWSKDTMHDSIVVRARDEHGISLESVAN